MGGPSQAAIARREKRARRALRLISELLKCQDRIFLFWPTGRSVVVEDNDAPLRSVELYTYRMQLSDGGLTEHHPEAYDPEKALAWLRGEW